MLCAPVTSKKTVTSKLRQSTEHARNIHGGGLGWAAAAAGWAAAGWAAGAAAARAGATAAAAAMVVAVAMAVAVAVDPNRD